MAKSAEQDKVVKPGDINVYDVRSAVKDLKEAGELIETDVEVDPDVEFAAIQKKLDGGPALLFNNVKGQPHARFLTNLFAQRSRIDRMFGFEDRVDRTRKIADAINNPIEPVIVDSEDAQVHEVVYEGDDIGEVDEIVPPIRHTRKEPELTTGSGNSVVYGEVFDGGSHIGYNRMNFRWGDVGTFQAAPGSHMWMIQKSYYDQDDPKIPITMNFGVPPAATLAAGAGFDYVVLPKGSDELGMAGAVQGEAIELVEAKTIDNAYGIANAEYTIEGYLKPKDRRWETAESEESGEQGRHPFHPEWAGYMGKAYKATTFHVTAVTHREDRPIIMPLIVHSADDSNIDTTVREAAFYELAERIQPDIVTDVHIPYSMTDWGGVIYQIDKQNPVDEGYHRNYLTSALGTSRGLRMAIAVDTDVDIYDMDEIMWALTTRVNPQEDIINPVPGGAGQAFQPAERSTAGAEQWTQSHTKFEGGMAIDATIPYGMDEDFERPQYNVEEVEDLTKWFTEEEVEKAEASMEGWVELLSQTGW